MLLIGACSSVSQPVNPSVFYKRDIEIEVNGKRGVGTLSVPMAPKYSIRITSPGNMDLGTFTTCHREVNVEAIGHEWEWNKPLVPVAGIEDAEGGCPAFIGAFERKKGRYAWGHIDFADKWTTLPAILKCNGVVSTEPGVSICQSAKELLQEISFEMDVAVRPDKKCPMDVTDGKVFRYKINPGDCVFNFMEKKFPFRVHRHSTIGYDQILLRE